MAELTIRPTTKFIRAGTVLAVLIVVGLEVMCLISWNAAVGTWLMLPPLLILLWPGARAMRRRFTRTTITGDRLRFESGFFSKSTRTIQLSKIQDVRVEQRLLQRVVNVGDLSIETAGEASRLTIHNVDDPQKLADELMDRAQRGPVS